MRTLLCGVGVDNISHSKHEHPISHSKPRVNCSLVSKFSWWETCSSTRNEAKNSGMSFLPNVCSSEKRGYATNQIGDRSMTNLHSKAARPSERTEELRDTYIETNAMKHATLQKCFRLSTWAVINTLIKPQVHLKIFSYPRSYDHHPIYHHGDLKFFCKNSTHSQLITT